MKTSDSTVCAHGVANIFQPERIRQHRLQPISLRAHRHWASSE